MLDESQTIDAALVARLAENLLRADADGAPCEPLRHALAERDIASAYAVQRAVTEKRLAAGARLVGRKIGLTAKTLREQLRIHEPDYGVLFDDIVVASGHTVEPGTAGAMQPRIEAEIAFILERDLSNERPSAIDVARATAYAVPAIEIVCSRIADWDINIVDTIADNASAGLMILARIIHEKCAIKAKPLLSLTIMRMDCLMKFFAMKSLAQVFGGLGRFRAVR